MNTSQQSPALPTPTKNNSIFSWMKKNLFSSIASTLTTIFCLYGLFVIMQPIYNWAIVNADWVGTSENDCNSSGACWIFIRSWFNFFIYGTYPADQQWRINVVFLLLIGIFFLQYLLPQKYRNRFILYALIALPVVAVAILHGGFLGLTVVETDDWGGFSLNIFVAVGGIVMALPIGILWALGRTSTMPLIRIPCIISIEVFRGVPLITLLFVAAVMLPLFFPPSQQAEVNKLLRIAIVITLFQSAYMAEVVRSGLQAIPKGQYNAADALGLNYWQKMFLIILPQALKISIPNIVNTFIALFKDTTLLLIISMFEVLTSAKLALANSYWLEGHEIEAYVFVAFMFWICCFSMSRFSMSIERKLDMEHQR